MATLPVNAAKSQQQAFSNAASKSSEEVAEDWKRKFQATEQYRRNVVEPLGGLPRDGRAAAPPKRHHELIDTCASGARFTRRYLEVLSRDKFNLLILFWPGANQSRF